MFMSLLFGIVLGIQRGLAPSALSFYLRRKAKTFPGRWGGMKTFFAPAIPDILVCCLLAILLVSIHCVHMFVVVAAGLTLLWRGIREARFAQKADDLFTNTATIRFPFHAPSTLPQAAINDFLSIRLYLDSLPIAGVLLVLLVPSPALSGNLFWFFLVYLAIASCIRYFLTVFRYRFRRRRRRIRVKKATTTPESKPVHDFRYFDMPDYLFSLLLIIMGCYFIIVGLWAIMW
ncbi:MAG: hypothetical protein PHQ75_14295 [Thermoguttaceae bacterium]|nr:hypothetical protein [Thermoguttaceae bacterium]